jgi:hypothetical protein
MPPYNNSYEADRIKKKNKQTFGQQAPYHRTADYSSVVLAGIIG